MSKKVQKKQVNTPMEENDINPKIFARLQDGFKRTAKTETVPVNQLSKLLSNCKEEIHQDDIDEVLLMMEKSDNDTFTFEEFCDFYQKVNSPMRVLEAFRAFDKDNNGMISKAEFGFILRAYNASLSEEDIKEMFDLFDLNQDGALSYQEFVSFWNDK